MWVPKACSTKRSLEKLQRKKGKRKRISKHSYYDDEDPVRGPSTLRSMWAGWMINQDSCWRVANIRMVPNDHGTASGVRFFQTKEDIPRPDKVPGNIVRQRHDLANDQFNLYLRQCDVDMETFEAAIDGHPLVRNSTLEFSSSSKLLNSSLSCHEGLLWNARFRTWDNDLIYAGLTRCKEGEDERGIQTTHAWIRFEASKVPTANHSRLCDMLLNTCGYYSWFEFGHVQRDTLAPGAPLPPGFGIAPPLVPQGPSIRERLEKLKETGREYVFDGVHRTLEIVVAAARKGASTILAASSRAPAVQSQVEAPQIVGGDELRFLASKSEVSCELDRQSLTNSPSSQPSPAGGLCSDATPLPGPPPDLNPGPPPGPLPRFQVRPPASTMASQNGMRHPMAPPWLDPQLPTLQGDAMRQLVAPPGELDLQLPTKRGEEDADFCASWLRQLMVDPAHASKPGASHDGDEVHLQVNCSLT